MNKDLEIIRKKYGEKMMHLCRELFPTLLEEEGLLSKLMLDNFAPSKFLYDDIISQSKVYNFKNYVYSLVDVEKKEIIINKTPKELLEEVGYNLYECKTEEEIQKFKKYYAKGEALCTFNGGRLNSCHVFFAVKKNVDEIKRENFKNPNRQDEYGTSVISIQFTKGDINTLSIKNRYNHTVNNPDATFSNNLENIIPGLTESFENNYNLNINQNGNGGFELPNYVRANDGKYYKYNYEINNIYYCPNNIIIDNFNKKEYDHERYIILDYFILDLKEKTITMYDKQVEDSFIDGIKNIQKISVKKENENKVITIETIDNKEIIIKVDKQNGIIEYKNNELRKLERNFLLRNITLEKLELLNVEKIGDTVLCANRKLREINLPKLKEIGAGSLNYNLELEILNLPELEKIGAHCLSFNKKLREINLPKLKYVGHYFLSENRELEILDLPELEKVGASFFWWNEKIRILNLPKLENVGDFFLKCNMELEMLDLPKLQRVGNYFLSDNEKLRIVNLPKLRDICTEFLTHNKKIEHLTLPDLKKIYIESYRDIYKLKIKSIMRGNFVTKAINKIFIRRDNSLEGNHKK